MKKIIYLIMMISFSAAAQEKKIIKIPPSKDTTVVTINYVTTLPVTTITTGLSSISVSTTQPPVDPGGGQTVPGTRKNLIQESLFEGSLFDGFKMTGYQYCCDYSMTKVKSPDGLDNNVIRYDLKKTDAIVSSSKRAEMELNSTSEAPERSERWYGMRYFFEKYDSDAGAESIIQWHDKDGSTPPLSIHIQNGRMDVTQSFKAEGNLHYDLGPVVLGKWVNIVIHVKWSPDNDGVLQVWVNDISKLNKLNFKTNSPGGSYGKIGINKWSWAPGGGSSTASERIYYMDDFRIGNELATYNDVKP